MPRIPLHRNKVILALAAIASIAFSQLPPDAQSQSSPFGDLGQHTAAPKGASVSYLFPEQVTLPADKPTGIDLHFKVADGLHVNSHIPHTKDLIPTTFKVPESTGVRLVNAQFPAGTDFAFPISPNEKLSVYSGEFIIHAELSAPRGEHLVEATLRYQACDNNACMPPHSIPVVIDVIAK